MGNIQQELETFREELETYYDLRWKTILKHEDLTRAEATQAGQLHDSLAVKVGKFKDLISDATGIPQKGQEDIWVIAIAYTPTSHVISALDQIIQATSLAVGKITRDVELGRRDIQTGELLDKSATAKPEGLKAFVAHEGETEFLKKLRDFLDALDIEYYIAEAEASNGRSVERQVDWTQAKADFAICLATAGKAINKETGKPYMALNIADELGRARQIFKNRVILLVQEGVEVHTNTREMVYAPFNTQSMDVAFIKVAKELRNWGFIQAGKT